MAYTEYDSLSRGIVAFKDLTNGRAIKGKGGITFKIAGELLEKNEVHVVFK